MAEFYCPDCEWGSARNNQGKTTYPNYIVRWTRSPETRNDANMLFYQGKLRSQPDGATIDEMHSWYHDMDKLERKHGYIQWLFPVSGSSGQNEESQPLQPAEAEAIKNDEAAQKRLLKSYEMMLNFYGMQIHDYWTGELRPAPHWKKRFANLNSSTLNHVRITQMIESIGELGLERYQFCLVKFLLEQAILTGELRNTLNSCKTYWIPRVKNDMERATLLQRCADYELQSRRRAELEKFAAMEAASPTPTSTQAPDKRCQNDASQQLQINQDASIDQLLSIDKTADRQALALPLNLVPTVPCQALPTAASGTKGSAPSTPRAAGAETLIPSTLRTTEAKSPSPSTPKTTGDKSLNPPPLRATAAKSQHLSTPRATVAGSLNPSTTRASGAETLNSSTPRASSAESKNPTTPGATGTESLNPSTPSTQSLSKGLFRQTKPPENDDPSSKQKARCKEEIVFFTTQLFDIWSNINRLVREPSAETALETGAQLSEMVRLTDTLKKVSTQLEYTSMELGVLVSKDFSQKNCKKNLAIKVLEPSPSAAALLRSYVAPTISHTASSLSEEEKTCPKDLQENATVLPANYIKIADADMSSFSKENIQSLEQHEQCLPTKLNDRSADECSALQSRDSCMGEPNDHAPPDAVSGCQFEEIRLSHVEADQASFIRASHYPDTDEDSPCANESTTRTISFIVIDPSDESCSGELMDRPDHN